VAAAAGDPGAARAAGRGGGRLTRRLSGGSIVAGAVRRHRHRHRQARRDLRQRGPEGAAEELSHFVVAVRDLAAAPLESWGPALRRAAVLGAAGANVDLVAWRDDGALGIRTWERGVEGETLSCGSGAVAAAAVAFFREGRREVRVVPRSGVPLVVQFPLAGSAILEGDARVVLEGSVGPESVSGYPPC